MEGFYDPNTEDPTICWDDEAYKLSYLKELVKQDKSKASPFLTLDGKEYCNEEACLAQLLADEVLLSNESELVDRPFKVVDGKLYGDDSKPFTIDKPTTVLYVICNDVFYWGTADAIRLPHNEIGILYKMHMADKKWGALKWTCRQEHLRPQVPIVDMMKTEGVWDAELEALPAPALS